MWFSPEFFIAANVPRLHIVERRWKKPRVVSPKCFIEEIPYEEEKVKVKVSQVKKPSLIVPILNDEVLQQLKEEPSQDNEIHDILKNDPLFTPLDERTDNCVPLPYDYLLTQSHDNRMEHFRSFLD